MAQAEAPVAPDKQKNQAARAVKTGRRPGRPPGSGKKDSAAAVRPPGKRGPGRPPGTGKNQAACVPKNECLDVKLYAWRTLIWLVIGGIAIGLIVWLYRPYWNNLYALVYQPSPEPVATATPEDTPATSPTPKPLPQPVATISASFINDLIQAVIDSSSETEVMESTKAGLLSIIDKM